ncbi:MAG: hypothetical protein ABIQ72_16910 [Usitatibacter sp.]
MTTPPNRLMLRATLLAAAFTFSATAHATVFDDAYDCLKANAKMASIAADKGPKAVEFVVSQPQCVALVTSPAPIPTTMMVATIALAANGTLPQKNPACEGALYSAAAKPIAAILDKVGILPANLKKMLADQAATEALGQAIQAIPGAAVAFASFSCGCGLSDAGLNPPTIVMVYNAIKATTEKCTAIMSNLVEGGSEALVAGVSNLGDTFAGQSKHVDPQVYYKSIFLPRLMSDYELYGQQWYSVEISLSKSTGPQCEHYFDKHTMSVENASKTCGALSTQYINHYKQQLPILAEKNSMAKLRAGDAAMRLRLESDKSFAGKICLASANKAFPTNMPASSRYLNTCIADIGAYFGYEVKSDPSYSSNHHYLVKKVSDQQWTARIVAASKNPGGLKAGQLYDKTLAQVTAEWEKLHAQKDAQWIAAINTELGVMGAQAKKSEQEIKDKGAKDAAANKSANDKAFADAIAKAAVDCKDDRCKVELEEFMRSCKGSGTESQVMNGDLACAQNRPIAIDISIKRVAFYSALDFQVKKLFGIQCPKEMDCNSGVARQRAEIDAEATKVWNYVREQGLLRGTVSKAREKIAQESANMLAPVSAKKIVAENKPKGLVANIDPGRTGIGIGKVPTSPPLVTQAMPPKAPTEPGKLGNMAKTPPTFTPPPSVTQAMPAKVPAEPVKGPNMAKPPPAFTAPPPVTVQAAPPASGAVMAAPPPTAKVPGNFNTPAMGGGMAGGGSFPKSGNVAGSLGGGTAAGSMKIEGCEPRGVQDPTTLVCTSDAGLNRCRSLIVSGKVKACIKK